MFPCTAEAQKCDINFEVHLAKDGEGEEEELVQAQLGSLVIYHLSTNSAAPYTPPSP